MKITESTIRRVMVRCWNRGRRNRNALNASADMVFRHVHMQEHFDKIKIKVGIIRKPRGQSRAVALMYYKFISYDDKNDSMKANHILRIDPIQLKKCGCKLEEVIAHELAHFIDHCSLRLSTHDLNFLHNMLLMTKKTNLEERILTFLSQYFYKNTKNGPTMNSYANVIKYTRYSK